jgi:hypothetical protein
MVRMIDLKVYTLVGISPELDRSRYVSNERLN